MGFLWGYQRVYHLILLLVIVTLYLAFYTTQYVFTKTLGGYSCVCWFPALGLLFIVFWITRGCGSCNCCFPWYHYTTLFLELVAQIASFGYNLYILIIYTLPTFVEYDTTYNYILYGLLTLTVVTYLLLVHKCVFFASLLTSLNSMNELLYTVAVGICTVQ